MTSRLASRHVHMEQGEKTAFIAPLSAGACTLLILLGIVVSVYWTFAFSPRGRATSTWSRIGYGVVLLLTVFQSALVIHELVWRSTLASDDKETTYQGPPFSQAFEAVVGSFQAGLSQSILIFRALKVGGRPYVLYGVLFIFSGMVIIEVLTGILVSVLTFRSHVGKFNQVFALNFEQAVELWMWLAAAANGIISITYTYLIHRRSKNGSNVTRSRFSSIAEWSVQSAVFSFILALLAAITTTALGSSDDKTSTVCYSFWLSLPILYALSLVSTLPVADSAVSQMEELKKEQADWSFAIVANGPQIFVNDGEARLSSTKGHEVKKEEEVRLRGKRETEDSLFP